MLYSALLTLVAILGNLLFASGPTIGSLRHVPDLGVPRMCGGRGGLVHVDYLPICITKPLGTVCN